MKFIKSKYPTRFPQLCREFYENNLHPEKIRGI